MSGHGEGEAADGVLLTEEKLDEEEEDGDRHNFASAKDGAKIVAANKDAKKPSAVLDSDSDTYLRNECKADKWLAVELSQVILYSAHSQSRVQDFPLYQIVPCKVRHVMLGMSGLRRRDTAIARMPVTSRRLQKPASSCVLSGGLSLGMTRLSRLQSFAHLKVNLELNMECVQTYGQTFEHSCTQLKGLQFHENFSATAGLKVSLLTHTPKLDWNSLCQA